MRCLALCSKILSEDSVPWLQSAAAEVQKPLTCNRTEPPEGLQFLIV